MKLLLTAFDPFGGEAVNPAWEAVARISDAVGGVEIVRLKVPTVFHKSIKTVTEAMDRERPDAVLCAGQAAGSAAIALERVAINLDDARIPDNEGNRPVDVPIAPDGPAAFFSTLPVKAMAEEIRSRGLPAAVSNSAGTFVCNHLLYGVLLHMERHFPRGRAGFIHVPLLPQQAAARETPTPSMSPEHIVSGLEAAILAIDKSR